MPTSVLLRHRLPDPAPEQEPDGLSLRLFGLVEFLDRASRLAYGAQPELTGFEARLLCEACRTPGQSINELSAALDRGVGQVSRAVKRLVGEGLLSSGRKGGGPGVIIRPTEAGRQAYAEILTDATGADRRLASGLSAEELRVFDRCLRTMRRNALSPIRPV